MRLFCGSLGAVLAVSLVAATFAAAQDTPPSQPPAQNATAPNPVVEAFRAYQGALAAGDVDGALAAGERAWRLSKERTGLSGRTGILAFNYASTLIEANRAAQAVAPARDAEAVLIAGAAGLDPVSVKALLGAALVAVKDGSGRGLIEEALQAANPADDTQAHAAFLAAMQLGYAFFDNRSWSDAARVFEKAAQFSPGDGLRQRVNRTTSLIAQTSSLAQMRRWTDAFNVAMRATEAITPMAPFTSGRETTEEEKLYAQAMAWENVLQAAAPRLRRARASVEQRCTSAPNTCEARPRPAEYADACANSVFKPPSNLERFIMPSGQPGGVVVRAMFDSEGVPVFATVIAQVGVRNENYEKNSVQLTMESRLQRGEGDPPTCRLDRTAFLTSIVFQAAH